MIAMNFQPKVRQLEQIRIDFDDSVTTEGARLPKNIKSKKLFDNGPTNNKRLFLKKDSKVGLSMESEDKQP